MMGPPTIPLTYVLNLLYDQDPDNESFPLNLDPSILKQERVILAYHEHNKRDVAIPFVALLKAIQTKSNVQVLVNSNKEAEQLKTAVNETYTLDSVIPESNAEAGLPDETSFSSRYVEWARLKRVDGEIRIQVSFSAADPNLAGKRLILAPEETGFGMLKWTCKQAGFGYTLPYDLMPTSCRNPYWD